MKNLKETTIDYLEKLIISLKDDIHFIQNNCKSDIEVLKYMVEKSNLVNMDYDKIRNIKR